MRLVNIATVITALAVAVAAPAIAAKGGNGNGNGGGSDGGSPTSKPGSYAPTLSVVWPLAAASLDTSTDTPYVIEGCGYDSSYGVVTVVVYTPVAAAFTSRTPDGGCISVSNFSTQGAGSYRIEAHQLVRNRDVVVATTGFEQ
jgi:hypothetical protein